MSVSKRIVLTLAITGLAVVGLYMVQENPAEIDSQVITRLNIAILPGQDKQALRNSHMPLIRHLESQLSIPCTLLIPDSYQQLLEWFGQGRVDLVNFGGVTYIKAHEKYAAVPLVRRDIDGQFRSVIIIDADLPAKTIHDLKGYSFAFGSKLSTSGHVLPRHFLALEGIEPENFFKSVSYSGAHDRTGLWVNNGKVQAGVANSQIIQDMYASGKLHSSHVRILWESPPYTDNVWAVAASLPNDIRQKISDAFLLLNRDGSDKEKMLDLLGAGYYVPADHHEFYMLEKLLERKDSDA